MIKERRNVLIKNVPIEVEINVRKDKCSGTIGLGGRDNLEENKGMLFVGDRDKNGHNRIWMKDMKFPIDIIWIAHGKVIHVLENASLPTKKGIPEYGFIGYCDYELEVKAGFLKRHGIKVGDKFYGVKSSEF